MEKFTRGTEKDFYYLNILDVCGAVHSSKTGGSDPLSYGELEFFKEILEKKLHNWVCLQKETEKYDNAVKTLCKCALKDCNKQLLEYIFDFSFSISKTIDILTKELEENVQK